MKKQTLYGPVSLIVAWYLIRLVGLVHPLFLPFPHDVMVMLGKLLLHIAIWADIGSTILRILVSFLAAALLGVPIGLAMGQYRVVGDSLDLLVDFFRSLPALALFPLFMFFFGIGDTAKIVTALFSCALIIIVNSSYGVAHSRKTRQVVAKILGATPLEVFTRVVFKDALPQIFVGLRTSLSLAVVVIVVTEMFVGTNRGVGHRIFESQLTYRVPEMYASIVVAGLIGYGLNRAFVVLEQRAIHWSGK